MAVKASIFDLGSPIANRAIHFRIYPRPSNLSESRQILTHLSSYGPLTYYRNLKYDRLTSPTSGLAIFASSEPAQRLVSQSPLTHTIQIPKPQTGMKKALGTMTREFQIQVNWSTYNHRDHIDVSQHNGGFALDRKSARQEDLKTRVPLKGLSEIAPWKRVEKPWRIVAWQKRREVEGRKSLREMYETGLREKEEMEKR